MQVTLHKRESYTNCFMNKHYIKGVQQNYLLRLGKITMKLYHSPAKLETPSYHETSQPIPYSIKIWIHIDMYLVMVLRDKLVVSCNLQSFLLRCGRRTYDWGTQWESNSLVKMCLFSLLTITPPESPNLQWVRFLLIALNFILQLS